MYIHIDIDFTIPYINIDLMDLTLFLLIVQILNLFRKLYKIILSIKSLVEKGDYICLIYLTYINITFIVLYLLFNI